MTEQTFGPAKGAKIVTAEDMLKLLRQNTVDKPKVETRNEAKIDQPKEETQKDEEEQKDENLNVSIAPPKEEVTFHFEKSIGLLIQKYHEVIIQDNYIILIKDSRWPYGPYYIPPIAKSGEDIFTIQYKGKYYKAFYFGLYFTLSKFNLEIIILYNKTNG